MANRNQSFSLSDGITHDDAYTSGNTDGSNSLPQNKKRKRLSKAENAKIVEEVKKLYCEGHPWLAIALSLGVSVKKVEHILCELLQQNAIERVKQKYRIAALTGTLKQACGFAAECEYVMIEQIEGGVKLTPYPTH